ncbi:GPN-loop GTPase 3-like [Anabrus simplex]|uniref:GPN-loop GTPase 3-like n=1 Tax=Anabrus simplex TaxID=316456 RepID=UPI0035A327FC
MGSIIINYIDVVNLDPKAEYCDYLPVAYIRELIHLHDVIEDEELDSIEFDKEVACPVARWMSVVDSQFMVHGDKFLSGSMVALSL